MKVIVIGGTGTIGGAVVELLKPDHEVVVASRSSGDVRVDMTERDSIVAMFERLGRFDALVAAAGTGAWKPLPELTDEDFQKALAYKLMGQVNLVRYGLQFVAEGGSFTLTSGVLATQPMEGSATVSLVNAGVEGFARAAALEAPRGIRLNVVSPPWVSETLEAMGKAGEDGLPAHVVARAYRHSVDGDVTGRVLDPREFADRDG